MCSNVRNNWKGNQKVGAKAIFLPSCGRKEALSVQSSSMRVRWSLFPIRPDVTRGNRRIQKLSSRRENPDDHVSQRTPLHPSNHVTHSCVFHAIVPFPLFHCSYIQKKLNNRRFPPLDIDFRFPIWKENARRRTLRLNFIV